jgi:UDP:flavonoid glycosyltransferase YjiC (YdhE family)
MISHGGHGGVAPALAHGVPLLCIPGVCRYADARRSSYAPIRQGV